MLALSVSEVLFEAHPGADPGLLSNRRHQLVGRASLALLARKLELGPLLRLGRGEEASGGREKPKILEDAMEAVLGALFLDGGLPAVRTALLEVLGEELRAPFTARSSKNWKNLLQERLQARGVMPSYRLEEESGPPHQRRFRVAVVIDGAVVAEGEGSSKKGASQAAAEAALAVVP